MFCLDPIIWVLGLRLSLEIPEKFPGPLEPSGQTRDNTPEPAMQLDMGTKTLKTGAACTSNFQTVERWSGNYCPRKASVCCSEDLDFLKSACGVVEATEDVRVGPSVTALHLSMQRKGRGKSTCREPGPGEKLQGNRSRAKELLSNAAPRSSPGLLPTAPRREQECPWCSVFTSSL